MKRILVCVLVNIQNLSDCSPWSILLVDMLHLCFRALSKIVKNLASATQFYDCPTFCSMLNLHSGKEKICFLWNRIVNSRALRIAAGTLVLEVNLWLENNFALLLSRL